MRLTVPVSSLVAAMFLGGLTGSLPLRLQRSPAPVPTYTKDVAPILFKNCTGCHRPGEIGPMSLLTYDDVRPRAKDIRDKIAEGAMPPWHADMPHGTFLNERGLTEQEKSTIFRWVATVRRRATRRTCPARRTIPKGGSIGTPDVVFEMQEDYQVPADDVVQYEYFYIPTNFTEAEVGAGDRGPPGQPQRRAPRARPIPGQAGHAAHARA